MDNLLFICWWEEKEGCGFVPECVEECLLQSVSGHYIIITHISQPNQLTHTVYIGKGTAIHTYIHTCRPQVGHVMVAMVMLLSRWVCLWSSVKEKGFRHIGHKVKPSALGRTLYTHILQNLQSIYIQLASSRQQ